MKLKHIIVLACCLGTNALMAQEWVFEYESERQTTVRGTWDNEDKQTTTHGIGLLKSPGKDYGTRLIELDEDGVLVSYFHAKECDTKAAYYPYGQDSIVSVSRKCNGEWVNTFNLFDASGKKIFTQEFENKYSSDGIIEIAKDISILRVDYRNFGTQFHLVELALNGEINQFSYNFSDFKDEDLKVSIRGCVKLKSGEYLMGAQLYETNESVVTNHYFKLFLVKDGAIKWVKSFKEKLQTIQFLVKAELGYLIKGKDYLGKEIVFSVDKMGNELNSFRPQVSARYFGRNYFFKANRLYSIDTKSKTIIEINEYDTNTGEVIWNRRIRTDYWRISNLKIGVVQNEYMVITGGCVRSSVTKEARAFVMRISLLEALEDEPPEIKNMVYAIEDLVQEAAAEVKSVKVYPNPARFRITFEIEGEEQLSNRLINIYNLNGQIVKSLVFIGNQFQADISTLVSGAYFYAITAPDQGNTLKGKFIVH